MAHCDVFRDLSQVLLHVTHSNLKARIFELRLDRHMTIDSLKDKLRTHTGTGSAFMHLTLLDDNGQVCEHLFYGLPAVRFSFMVWRLRRAACGGDRGKIIGRCATCLV